MSEYPDVIIIGMGALGRTLADALQNISVPIKSVVTSKKKEALSFSGMNPAVYKSVNELKIEEPAILFIAVPDDIIEKVASDIAAIKGVEWESVVITHCSGAQTSDFLDILKKRGASVAAFHPLQTFSMFSEADSFQDIFISIEGDQKAVHVLDNMARELGSKTLILSKEQKQKLHISAVFASNFLVAIMNAAENLADETGIDDSFSVLKPLVEQTLGNIYNGGTEKALSGPLVRGDTKTIKNHLELLKSKPRLRELYISAGLYILSELNGKSLPDQKIKILEHLFTDGREKAKE
ncbi:MAG: Rossmann-like and DUF2520 domain-containing protein [Balneolaceae bacterium]